MKTETAISPIVMETAVPAPMPSSGGRTVMKMYA